MRLKELLADAGAVKVCADENFEVRSLKIHSAKVEDGDLFFCMKGVRDDGAAHLGEVKAKAFVAVTDRVPEVECAYVLRRLPRIISRPSSRRRG